MVELIVSLAVVSVASGVFISLYLSSLNMAAAAQRREMAAQLAQEQLGEIMAHPGQYQWKAPEGDASTLFSIQIGDDDPKAGNLFAPPAVLPTLPSAYQREMNRYAEFRWEAQGRIPAVNASSVEVTVLVHWKQEGRPQFFALTSRVPRSSIANQGGNRS
jgi:type II secretory pathway pseudopilin PulG